MGFYKGMAGQTAPRDRRGRSETGWPPGSIGDISARIGYDVRDLKMAGYSDAEIDEVLYGRCTLAELLQRAPRRNDD